MKRLLLALMLFVSSNAFADTAILQSSDGTAISSANPLQVTFGEGTQTMSGAMGERLSGSNVNRYIDYNDNPYATTIGGGLFLRYSNIWFLEEGEDIDAFIASDEVVDGDTIYLASGTYTTTADIDVTKAVHIVGQGIGKTIISTSTGSLNIFDISKDGASISNLSISSTGTGTQIGINVSGVSGTRFTNINLSNLLITMSSTAVQRGIVLLDSGANIRNVVGSITSSNNEASGLRVGPASTMEATATVNVYNSWMSVSSGSSTGHAFRFSESTATQVLTANVYDSYGFAVEGASSSSAGIYSNAASAADIVVNVYGGAYSGTDNDAEIAGTGVLNPSATTVFVNNKISGTVTPAGYTLLKRVTADPCTSGAPEGALFWNDTANELCVCDGTNDIRVKDFTTACF